jgi:hypothetical protein
LRAIGRLAAGLSVRHDGGKKKCEDTQKILHSKDILLQNKR